ncbi:MAG: hypothetical protein ACI4RJ_05565 [Alphaproteobacteria bacterium]
MTMRKQTERSMTEMLGGSNLCIKCSYIYGRGNAAGPDECQALYKSLF